MTSCAINYICSVKQITGLYTLKIFHYTYTVFVIRICCLCILCAVVQFRKASAFFPCKRYSVSVRKRVAVCVVFKSIRYKKSGNILVIVLMYSYIYAVIQYLRDHNRQRFKYILTVNIRLL